MILRTRTTPQRKVTTSVNRNIKKQAFYTLIHGHSVGTEPHRPLPGTERWNINWSWSVSVQQL